MSSLLNRPELSATPAADDLLHIIDVSDTTDGANGTSKKITRENLVAGIGGGGDGFSQCFITTSNTVITTAQATQNQTHDGLADTLTLVPFTAPRDVTIDSIGFENISTSVNIYMCIFESGSDGLPNNLLRATTTQSAPSAAGYEFSITATTLSGGNLYWVGFLADSTFDMRGTRYENVTPISGLDNFDSFGMPAYLSINALYSNGVPSTVSPSFPSDFVGSGTEVPVINMRVQ